MAAIPRKDGAPVATPFIDFPLIRGGPHAVLERRRRALRDIAGRLRHQSESAIAAWGGVAGAANAAQLSFDDSGLAPLDRVRESEAFVSELKKLQQNLGDLKANTGPAEQYLVQLRTVCTYSGPPQDNFGTSNGGGGGAGGGAGGS